MYKKRFRLLLSKEQCFSLKSKSLVVVETVGRVENPVFDAFNPSKSINQERSDLLFFFASFLFCSKLCLKPFRRRFNGY